ncbi:hypothetical protein CBL_01130 [Carabus blaptoides fortunei]
MFLAAGHYKDLWNSQDSSTRLKFVVHTCDKRPSCSATQYDGGSIVVFATAHRHDAILRQRMDASCIEPTERRDERRRRKVATSRVRPVARHVVNCRNYFAYHLLSYKNIGISADIGLLGTNIIE